jgi:hypothetical protein
MTRRVYVQNGQVLTRAQVRKLTRTPEPSAAQRSEHERLWRVLRAIEQISEQDVTPKQWLDALPDYTIPGGQVKLLHPWPGQNPPPLRRGDG